MIHPRNHCFIFNEVNNDAKIFNGFLNDFSKIAIF
jgi:hypothetical protein